MTRERSMPVSGHGDRSAVSLGSRTTVFAVLQAYPFLEAFLHAYHPAFGRLTGPGGAWDGRA